MTLDNAVSCVAGYTCCNEGSIREFQRHTTQWHMGKNFDKSGSIGPWVVTADELPPGGKGLKIESRLSGKVMQSDNTDNMMFPVAETIVYATQGITLEPGDLLVTGTPSGVGHARKPPAWIRTATPARSRSRRLESCVTRSRTRSRSRSLADRAGRRADVRGVFLSPCGAPSDCAASRKMKGFDAKLE